tara:strand:+ start:694 stop:1104 length:411 start_codon:yes stop_codon:yes gene_type:complete
LSLATDIRTALETTLSAVTGVPAAIAFDNVKFQNTANAAWLRASVDYTAQTNAGIGVGAPIQSQGLLNVDYFIPENQGAGDGEIILDAIRDAFAPGTIIVQNGRWIRILSAQRAQNIPVSPWYQMPLIISWYVYEL